MDDLEIRSLIYNIMDKALVKNAQTKADIFVSLKPNLKLLTFEVYNDGWRNWKDTDYYREIRISPSSVEARETVINNLVDVCEVIDSI